MTNDQIRRRIAEACGWKRDDGFWWIRPDGKEVPENFIPNYPESHDAMAEALGTLSYEDLPKYGVELFAVIFGHRPTHWEMQWAMLMATPLQKAEAFLKDKGLWEDGE